MQYSRIATNKDNIQHKSFTFVANKIRHIFAINNNIIAPKRCQTQQQNALGVFSQLLLV